MVRVKRTPLRLCEDRNGTLLYRDESGSTVRRSSIGQPLIPKRDRYCRLILDMASGGEHFTTRDIYGNADRSWRHKSFTRVDRVTIEAAVRELLNHGLLEIVGTRRICGGRGKQPRIYGLRKVVQGNDRKGNVESEK